jgi:hypothetical protein
MSCSDVRKTLLESDESFLSAAQQQHLAGCPGCQGARDRVRITRQLLVLKNYEKPDRLFETRNRITIRQKLQDLKESPPSIGARWLEWLTGPALTPLRIGLAAAVLLLLGIQAVSLYLAPPLQGPSLQTFDAPAVTPRLVASATNVPAHLFTPAPDQLVQIASNGGPESIRYGPASRVVNFETTP